MKPSLLDSVNTDQNTIRDLVALFSIR